MDFTSDYRYNRASYRINVSGQLFYSHGLSDPSADRTNDAIELRIEDDDNLYSVKNAIEAHLKTPVYIYNSFKIKEKNKDYLELPLIPPKNLNGILPSVNRDIYFTRQDRCNQLIKDVVQHGEPLMAVSLRAYKALYGEDVDDNVLWAYFDGQADTPDGFLSLKAISEISHLKQHYADIAVEPEIVEAFTPCILLEAVLHINYYENAVEYIELEKLFRMFPLSEGTPIVRYRTGSNIEPFYKIHKSLTVEFAKEELKDLLKTSASVKDKRYIGFKIRGTDPRRFYTVNLYADGKIDIYCAWEEKMGGTKEDLVKVVELVIDLIDQINQLNYHKIGIDSTIRLEPPNTNFTGNTSVSNYNTMNYINLSEDDLNFAQLEKKIADFSSLVTVVKTDVPDKMVLRYKKITNYATTENIKKFVRTAGVKGEELMAALQTVFDLSPRQARAYADAFGGETEKTQKPSYPGTLIELTRPATSTAIRCKFLGANNETIGIIYSFMQKMFQYGLKGKKRPRIVAKKDIAESAAAGNKSLTIRDAAGVEKIILDAAGKVNMTKPKPSLLDYLKIMGLPYIPDKNKDSKLPNYARETCQCHKHPVVIYKDDHYKKLKAVLETTKDNTEEMNLNRLSFKQGQKDKNGFFYFCPVTWDQQNIKHMDAGEEPYFPKFSEVSKDKENTFFRRKAEELKSLYARNDGNGFCCYVNPQKEAETEENKVKTQSYILKSNVDLSPGRFGWLTENLNDMFNPEDQKQRALKNAYPFTMYLWMHPGYITDETDDSSFLACIARVKDTTVDKTIEELASDLHQNPLIFQSLKMGSIYSIFTPQDEYSNRLSIQEALGSGRIIEEFILYIMKHRQAINEDYLWDYFTEKLGLNLFILENDELKCPKGYELNKVYQAPRPSLILSKKEQKYYILSYTTFKTGNATPKYNILHNTQEESHVKSFYETVTVNCQVKSDRLTLEQLKAKIPAMMTVLYPQIVDSYNKVRYVRVKMNDAVFWFPLEPSGIDAREAVLPLSGLLGGPSLSSVFDTIEVFETLALYYGFDGYLVKNVLLRYGLDMDNAQEDTVVGVRLENNLVVYTEPLPVQVFQSVRYFRIVQPDTNVEKHIMNTFMMTREDVWFNDDYDYEQGKGQVEKDMRQIYVTRLHFEQEAYERFRILVSRLLQEQPDVRQEITTLIQPSTEDLSLYRILKKLVTSAVTHQASAELLNALGPIDCGYKDISPEDLKNYSFVEPRVEPDAAPLFVPDVNLITGAKNNMDYYLYRVVEELQRSAFKRDEILNNLLVAATADYYLENTDKAIDKLYETRTSIEEKMVHHFDVLNVNGEPTAATYLLNLKQLPVYWREKLHNADSTFFVLDDIPDLYAELDRILQTRDAPILPHLEKYVKFSPDRQMIEQIYQGSKSNARILDLHLIAKLYNVSFLILSDLTVTRIGDTERYIILYKDGLVLSDQKQKLFPAGDLPVYLSDIQPTDLDYQKLKLTEEIVRKRKASPEPAVNIGEKPKPKIKLKPKSAVAPPEPVLAPPEPALAPEPAVAPTEPALAPSEPALAPPEPLKRLTFKRKIPGEAAIPTEGSSKRVFRPKKK